MVACDTCFAPPSLPRAQPPVLIDSIGSCFCGSVRIHLRFASAPLFRIACHCNDCRAFHGAPYVHSVGFPLDVGDAHGESGHGDSVGLRAGPFAVIGGAEHIGKINKTGALER